MRLYNDSFATNGSPPLFCREANLKANALFSRTHSREFDAGTDRLSTQSETGARRCVVKTRVSREKKTYSPERKLDLLDAINKISEVRHC